MLRVYFEPGRSLWEVQYVEYNSPHLSNLLKRKPYFDFPESKGEEAEDLKKLLNDNQVKLEE